MSLRYIIAGTILGLSGLGILASSTIKKPEIAVNGHHVAIQQTFPAQIDFEDKTAYDLFANKLYPQLKKDYQTQLQGRDFTPTEILQILGKIDTETETQHIGKITQDELLEALYQQKQGKFTIELEGRINDAWGQYESPSQSYDAWGVKSWMQELKQRRGW